MEIASKRTYSNSIYSAIIVNSDYNSDPAGLGRVQIMIPYIHQAYLETYTDYMSANNKSELSGWNEFPWATTLVKDLENGNVVYCGNVNNSNNEYVVYGIDVNNPANSSSSGLGLDNLEIGGLLDLAMPIIIHNEVGINTSDWPNNIPTSRYTNINPYDNGGWSIGLIQWHHCRAFDCLYQIAKADSSWESKATNSKLDLVQDLKSATSNNSTAGYRTKYQASFHPTSGTEQYNFIQAMLGSEIGKETQRKYASEDTSDSISKVMGSPYEINNPAVIIWLVDIMNQYGSGINKTIQAAATICKDSSKDMMTQLSEFRNWCKSNLGSYNTYINRRNTTYSYIENLERVGKLSITNADLTDIITSKYIPDTGKYVWPVPSCDQINCFYGNTSQQAKYISGSEKGKYHWSGLWHDSPHSGIDIAPKKVGVPGDPCIAIGNGTVKHVQKGGPHASCGFYVVIELDNKVPGFPYVAYMHFCKQSELNVGDKVIGGKTIIGYMGTTGNSTGVHLHISLHSSPLFFGYNNSTDILPYLGKKS